MSKKMVCHIKFFKMFFMSIRWFLWYGQFWICFITIYFLSENAVSWFLKKSHKSITLTVRVILCKPPWKEGNFRFTMVPLKPLTVHRVERSFCLNISKPAWVPLKRNCTVQFELKQLICYLRNSKKDQLVYVFKYLKVNFYFDISEICNSLQTRFLAI